MKKWIVLLFRFMVSNLGGRIGMILGVVPLITFWVLGSLSNGVVCGLITSIVLGLFGAIMGKLAKKNLLSGIWGEIIGIILVVVLIVISVVFEKDSGASGKSGVFVGFMTAFMLYYGVAGAFVGILIRRELWGSILGIVLALVYIIVDLTRGNMYASSDVTNHFLTAGPVIILAFSIVGAIIGAIVKFIVKKVKKEESTTTDLTKEFQTRCYALLEKGDYDKVIAESNDVIQAAPDFFGGYDMRGTAYSEKGDFDKAIADFTEAIRLAPNSAAKAAEFGDRGMVYFGKGDFDKAVADFSEVIRHGSNSDKIGAYLFRGKAYSEIGHVQEAIRDYETFLELDPNNDNAEMVRDALRELRG